MVALYLSLLFGGSWVDIAKEPGSWVNVEEEAPKQEAPPSKWPMYSEVYDTAIRNKKNVTVYSGPLDSPLVSFNRWKALSVGRLFCIDNQGAFPRGVHELNYKDGQLLFLSSDLIDSNDQLIETREFPIQGHDRWSPPPAKAMNPKNEWEMETEWEETEIPMEVENIWNRETMIPVRRRLFKGRACSR